MEIDIHKKSNRRITISNKIFKTMMAFCLACAIGCSNDDLALSKGNFVIRMSKDEAAISMKLSASDYAKWNTGSGLELGNVTVITEAIYSIFEDSFDFIILISNNDVNPLDVYSGRLNIAQNHIVGLGLGLFSRAEEYGSSGRLQSVLHLTEKDDLVNGPALHEIMHRWANYGIIATDELYHWGFSSVGGQLGGWKEGTLTSLGGGNYQANNGLSNGFGTYANSGNSVPYSNLELYLMGLIPPHEVTSITVAESPLWTNRSSGTFSASNLREITIDDITQEHGSRNPDYKSSHKSFRAIVVILTVTELTEAEWLFFSKQIYEFSVPGDDGISNRYNFWEATGGKAQIIMDNLKELLRSS